MANRRFRFISSKGKTLFQQKLDIQKKFPYFNIKINNNKLTCTGVVISSLTKNEYEIRIEKLINKSPKVFIIKPDIIKKHVYSDGSLCFYSSKNFKWNNNLLISDYHIPWTSAWIYFYEAWIITGIWFADEVEHGDKPKIQPI